MIRYSQVVADLMLLPNFLDYYYDQLEEAKRDCVIHGSVEKQIRDLPGITEHRFNQLQEIEAVLNYLNIELRKTRHREFKKYLENYNRALSSRDAQSYADAHDDVIEQETLINQVALLRNNYLGIMKALESKNFQLGHISRLRCAGLEDITV